MSIQNSINSALGTVAGAALGIKHAKDLSATKVEQTESKALTAEGEAGRATEASTEEINAFKKEGKVEKLAEADVALKTAKDELIAAEADFKAGKIGPSAYYGKKTQVEAAQKAFTALNDEYQGIIGRADRAKAMREFASRQRMQADDARAKHERLWGGK